MLVGLEAGAGAPTHMVGAQAPPITLFPTVNSSLNSIITRRVLPLLITRCNISVIVLSNKETKSWMNIYNS